MSEFAYQRLSGIVAELKELVPRFETSIEKLGENMSAMEEALNPKEPQYSGDFWVIAAYRNALVRLRLIIENDLFSLETLNVLATTRYVFEMLVWLRVLNQDAEYGLVFYYQTIEKQIQHFRDYRAKLANEISILNALGEEENDLFQDRVQKLADDPPPLTAERVSEETTSIMSEIDRKARRAFCLYAESARHNGYGFQAELIRTKAIPHVDTQIDELLAKKKAFVDICSDPVKTKLTERWNWKKKATLARMQDQYEFIYSYTSRLLHATPASILTDQKNLKPQEMLVFLDYIYVSMLDALELAARLNRSYDVPD